MEKRYLINIPLDDFYNIFLYLSFYYHRIISYKKKRLDMPIKNSRCNSVGLSDILWIQILT